MDPRRLLLALGSVTLLAAFRYPTALAPVEAAAQPAYAFVDARPAKQLDSGFESLMITSCAYGSTRIGSDDIQPAMPDVLKAMLAARFGDRLAGRSVELRSFTLHLNNALGLRGQVGSMYSGLIPSLMNDRKKVGCAPDDDRGSYTLGEVPVGAVPLVAAVEVTIDGQAYRGRAVAAYAVPFPPRGKKVTPEAKAAWDAAADHVVKAALGQLGDRIAHGVFGEPLPQALPSSDPSSPGSATDPAAPAASPPAVSTSDPATGAASGAPAAEPVGSEQPAPQAAAPSGPAAASPASPNPAPTP